MNMAMEMRIENEAVVCVVGLGYVGLPLAKNFSFIKKPLLKKETVKKQKEGENVAQVLEVIGFDIDEEKIEKLKKGIENNEFGFEVGDLSKSKIAFTSNPAEIRKADFVIIAVPTPVTKSKEPDLSYVKSAAEIIGKNLKKGAIVVLESTVYPGVTEEIIKPILEAESGMKCGVDFKIGYSPERINPGDDAHVMQNITKIVSGMDEETTDVVSKLCEKITSVYKAKDIKTAEAAKVIENIQRDLNIALMNELSLIFEKMGLNTKDVLDAASTKWNFHKYSPGLVGGHCIPVDPYYLVYKAKELGYHPQVILAGRSINDYMPKHVAEIAVKALNEAGKVIKGSKVLIMGLTYKENVPDTRESPVIGMIEELKEFGVDVYGYDPLLSKEETEAFGVKVLDFSFSTGFLFSKKKKNAPVLIDVRGMFDGEEAKRKGFYYRRL
jgi:UDPglucose 6-dehydrogenase/UDP-N-acetyl-D-galactosamine dehydrogenase